MGEKITYKLRRGYILLIGMVLSSMPLFSLASLPDLESHEQRLAGLAKVKVNQFAFEGNSIFSDEELDELLLEYKDQDLTIEELYKIKNLLTKFYIDRGYINSGVLLPDQEVTDGTVTYKIIEGKLTQINILGNKRLRSRYIKSRVQTGVSEPLNIFELRRPLQLMHQDPHIKRIQAELAPGSQPGEGILNVDVEEARRYSAAITANNHRSPSVGSYQVALDLAYRNLTGWGETLGGGYSLTSGLDSWNVYTGAPLTRWETYLTFSYEENRSNIISEAFNDLDIESESGTYSVSLRQPVYRTPSQEFSLEVSLDKKRSKTFLLGTGFSFPLTVDDGITEVTRFNFAQDWVKRSQTSVIAARSNFAFGLNWLNSTYNTNTDADAKFVTWLGQFQYLRRLPLWDSQVLFSTDVQLADSPLLPLERLAIGGNGTVRGYRENQLTRDNGLVSRLEWRIPVAKLRIPKVSKGINDGQIQVVPFTDYGRGWNRKTGTPEPPSISSIGTGVRWLPAKSMLAEAYWGHALRDIEQTDEYDLQDDGVHVQLIIKLF